MVDARYSIVNMSAIDFFMPEYEDKTKNAKDGYTILERICNVLEAEICPGIAASPLLAFQLLDSITNTLAN